MDYLTKATTNTTEYDRSTNEHQNPQQNEISASPLGEMPPEAASNNQPNHMLTKSRLAFGHLSLARLVNHAVSQTLRAGIARMEIIAAFNLKITNKRNTK